MNLTSERPDPVRPCTGQTRRAIGMQVIIEPDDIGPWVGLAGVIVGAAITVTVDWLRSRRTEAKERRRANQAAADELFAAANALITVRGVYNTQQAQAEPMHQWISLLMTQAERVQKSSEKLVRYAPPDLANLAMQVASAALKTAVHMGEGGFPAELERAMNKFAEKMRELPK
jgi:hypothetical protein